MGTNTIGNLSDPALISTLAAWLESSGARELEITTPDGGALKIVLDAAAHLVQGAGPAPVILPARPEGRPVKTPMAGIFRDRHPAATETGPPLADAGSVLGAGAVIGFVEVGPVLLPVTTPDAGVVGEIRARSGELIGYGDAVLTMEASR